MDVLEGERRGETLHSYIRVESEGGWWTPDGFSACKKALKRVWHEGGAMVRVIHDVGGVRHLVIWPNGSEVVKERISTRKNA